MRTILAVACDVLGIALCIALIAAAVAGLWLACYGIAVWAGA